MAEATTYTDALAQMDQVTQTISAAKANFDAALQQIDVAVASLANLPTAHAGLISFINGQADANPDDELWQTLRATKNKVVADFTADRNRMKAVADAAKAAG